jgi:hydrogen peroxide-dependent heme synthase
MSTSPPQTGPRSPAPDADSPARPPLTVEGWYALHQAFCIDRKALRALDAGEREAMLDAASAALEEIAHPGGGGWSAIVSLVGSRDDVLLMHFRPTFEAIRDAGHALWRIDPACILRQTFAFLSVTEVGLYHLADGGADAISDDVIRAEKDVPHTRQRLYPTLPPRMPWVSFYPTSKRRDEGQNWYALPLAERSALMRNHGTTGRRHAAHIRQIITGAIGLDDWEWGVTLFADDPLALKRVVTDMRFDEASARYAEFGRFWTGRLATPSEWRHLVGA